jgi:homoserine O-acetyltransferase/O-succinyltransferase
LPRTPPWAFGLKDQKLKTSNLTYKIFSSNVPFTLESGIVLPRYHLAYTTHGNLSSGGENVVWIFHALTANSDPGEWWSGLVGKGKIFDPSKYFIVCVNMPGSCYGSTGPLDIDPMSQDRYLHDFPFFTSRDMIRAYQPLREFLGIKKIHIGIGGSMGGQQLLEWAVEEPELFEYVFPLATNAQHSPWAIAFNASQRLCIEADATWKQKDILAGIEGMKVARSVALISYRHYETYLHSQQNEDDLQIENFKSETYQRYQGEKLAKRFNAFSYYKLSQSMDSHNVGRGRGGVQTALRRITAKTLAIGIETDILFPVVEQKFLAANIPGAAYKGIHSNFGHDGFLLEFEAIGGLINEFIHSKKISNRKFAVII